MYYHKEEEEEEKEVDVYDELEVFSYSYDQVTLSLNSDNDGNEDDVILHHIQVMKSFIINQQVRILIDCPHDVIGVLLDVVVCQQDPSLFICEVFDVLVKLLGDHRTYVSSYTYTSLALPSCYFQLLSSHRIKKRVVLMITRQQDVLIVVGELIRYVHITSY